MLVRWIVVAFLSAFVLYAYRRHKSTQERSEKRVTYSKRDDAFYERVTGQITAIEAEMRRVGLWQDTPLQPEQYDFRAAFAGDTMAFPQWLQFIFIPKVRQIINVRGAFPSSSQVAAYAVREFDTYREDTSQLITLLSDFDRLFTG